VAAILLGASESESLFFRIIEVTLDGTVLVARIHVGVVEFFVQLGPRLIVDEVEQPGRRQEFDYLGGPEMVDDGDARGTFDSKDLVGRDTINRYNRVGRDRGVVDLEAFTRGIAELIHEPENQRNVPGAQRNHGPFVAPDRNIFRVDRFKAKVLAELRQHRVFVLRGTFSDLRLTPRGRASETSPHQLVVVIREIPGESTLLMGLHGVGHGLALEYPGAHSTFSRAPGGIARHREIVGPGIGLE